MIGYPEEQAGNDSKDFLQPLSVTAKWINPIGIDPLVEIRSS
ncbi:MAG TPA: hypothetical protein VKV30_08395 [Candidatus Angelobacter sp.]|nr:hypothetical protein [Candidatus Angelobacter sp.]